MSQAGLFSVPQVRSWSWQAFVLAVAIVAASATFQGAACVAFGAQFYFAAFLPAIFVVGLLAGAPAAVFAILLSIPLVWWAFIPPFFEFSTLSRANAESINLFFLLAVLLIGLADLCRQIIAIINRGGLKPTDGSVAQNSR
jgi:K+-sensing histidine kinase KdpD